MTIDNSSALREIKELTDEELKHYLEIAADGTSGKTLATEELNCRRLRSIKKNHRTVIFRTSAVVLAIIFAVFIAINFAR